MSLSNALERIRAALRPDSNERRRVPAHMVAVKADDLHALIADWEAMDARLRDMHEAKAGGPNRVLYALETIARMAAEEPNEFTATLIAVQPDGIAVRGMVTPRWIGPGMRGSGALGRPPRPPDVGRRQALGVDAGKHPAPHGRGGHARTSPASAGAEPRRISRRSLSRLWWKEPHPMTDDNAKRLDELVSRMTPEQRRAWLGFDARMVIVDSVQVGEVVSFEMQSGGQIAEVLWPGPSSRMRDVSGTITVEFEDRDAVRELYRGFEVDPPKPRPRPAANAMMLGALREDAEKVQAFADRFGRKRVSKRAQRRARGRAKVQPVAMLPDGLFEVDGRLMYDCEVCDQATEWHGEPEEFEFGHPMNQCGRSPRCCP